MPHSGEGGSPGRRKRSATLDSMEDEPDSLDGETSEGPLGPIGGILPSRKQALKGVCSKSLNPIYISLTQVCLNGGTLSSTRPSRPHWWDITRALMGVCSKSLNPIL